MTLDQLVTLETINRLGSFKAASKAMHKSQPSLSVAIKNLESEFKLKLFNRDEYRPKLTKQGERFLKQAKFVLEEANKLEELARILTLGKEVEIKICADAIFPIHTVSEVFRQFFEPHINIDLDLSTDVLEGVLQKVKEHKVDFALGPKIESDDKLDFIPILKTKLIPVISSRYLNKLTQRSFIKELPQIVVKSTYSKAQSNIHGAFSYQFWYTTDFSMKEQLIKSGLGWGRLPEHQIKHELESNELLDLSDHSEISSQDIEMYLIKCPNHMFGPNVTNLWNYLKEKFT